LKSLAHVVLKIGSIVCQKVHGSRDLGHAPFGENFAYFYSDVPRSISVTNLKCLYFTISCFTIRYDRRD